MMTNDPSPTTPPPGGQPQALTDDEHERMIEFRTVWYGHATENDPSEESRLICRYCWHEGPDGKPRHQDWPCEVVRIRGALDEARARAAHFEALAKDQQATNAAMVASLQRGLAQLEASEAEVARLREAYLRLARGRALSDHWNTCGGCGPNAEGCLRSAEQDARETLAALAAMDRGRVPADQAWRKDADDGK
jgi:hypothetical protein